MILLLVCVCVGLALVAAVLAWLVDSGTRQIAACEKHNASLLIDNDELLDACDLHVKEMSQLEKKRIRGIEEMALDMCKLENRASILRGELDEAASVNEILGEQLSQQQAEAARNVGCVREAISKLRHVVE